jgi:hypothetical protein
MYSDKIAGIVKRLLDAMKGEIISEDVIPSFMEAFEALVTSNLSPEVMRSLSLFITYAFHVPSRSLPRTPRPGTPGIVRRATGDGPFSSSSSSSLTALTKKQLGTRVLSLYQRNLCEKGNVNNIKKFTRTVTNKVRLSTHTSKMTD